MAVRAPLLLVAAALALPSCASPTARPAREAARPAPASAPTLAGADQGALPPRRDGARESLDPAEGRMGGDGPAPRLRTEPGNAWVELDGWYAPRKPLPRPSAAAAAARDRAAGRVGGRLVPGAPLLAGEEGDFWADTRDRR
jgi:hypothetical protein